MVLSRIKVIEQYAHNFTNTISDTIAFETVRYMKLYFRRRIIHFSLVFLESEVDHTRRPLVFF